MWKEMQLAFSRPLTDQEERIMIAYFKTMTEKMKDVIKQGRTAYNNPVLRGAAKITGMGSTTDAMKFQMQFILDNLYQYTRLEKETPQLYRFRVKENALMIRAPLGQSVNLWERMQRKFDLKFKLELCRRLGIMPGDLQLGFNEVDDAPKEPGAGSTSQS